MKIAKKTLSVFLAFLMMFSACSVCLNGLPMSITASAATSAATVKDTVNAAAASAVGATPSSNTYTFTGDDGKVLAAAEAVYDYAQDRS